MGAVLAGSISVRLASFSAALDSEIAFIKKSSGDQSFELTSGQRDGKSRGMGGVYSFLLTDGALRLPEDASGTLRAAGRDMPSFVVAHEGSTIVLLVESAEELPPFIPVATLSLSETDLLERLKERMDELASTSSGMAAKVFGDEEARRGLGVLPTQVATRVGDGGMRVAIEQVLGSEVTFLWGPPGTGKTFGIAAIVAAVLEENETVLVSSHTHAAVEQALWAGIEPESEGREAGLLADAAAVANGEVLKVGPLRDPKIPTSCHLDSRLEEDSKRRRVELQEVLSRRTPLQAEMAECRRQLQAWDVFEKAQKVLGKAMDACAAAQASLATARSGEEISKRQLQNLRDELGRVEKTFFRRKAKVAVANSRVQNAVPGVAQAEAEVARRAGELAQAEANESALTTSRDEIWTQVHGLRRPDVLRPQLDELKTALDGVQAEADALQGPNNDLANRLLDSASALFATLTKLYIDPNLRSRSWDNVIIDEASMAMPPLVAWAASRARRRVVVCGDFRQLPPIVHSTDGIATEHLGTDLFEMRGIPAAIETSGSHPDLAMLMVQRRMHPHIAEAARILAYGSQLADHPDVRSRAAPPAVGLLERLARTANAEELAEEHGQLLLLSSPSARTKSDKGAPDPLSAPCVPAALVGVDTAALHAWSGKVRGSLSRFNFASGQVAVELAALYAAQTPKPAKGEARPIGIITPYAAQRRYLAKLLEAFGDLADWVAVGTVHTFQGNECDIVIFDSVLGEPHWTARLVDPHSKADVVKDLNVAVTRARHQLVFIGDGAWLDRKAKPSSALGLLWSHLRATAPILDVRLLLGSGVTEKLDDENLGYVGWGTPRSPGPVILYDEKTFYKAFIDDLAAAQEQVILYTPFIGKQRWPKIAGHVTAQAERGIQVVVLHKPLSDPDWQLKDPAFGRKVFDGLTAAGVTLVPISGIHAKTIIIDGHIVYEGSLNWASQTASYEHMLRIESRDVAALFEKMMQLREILPNFLSPASAEGRCPCCQGPLVVVSQVQQTRSDPQPMKLACAAHQRDKQACPGHLRGVDQRAPFLTPPICAEGMVMGLGRSKTGKPWNWRCSHGGCKRIRWRRGDVDPAA